MLNIKELKNNIDKFDNYCDYIQAEVLYKMLEKIVSKMDYQDAKIANDLLKFYKGIENKFESLEDSFYRAVGEHWEDDIEDLEAISNGWHTSNFYKYGDWEYGEGYDEDGIFRENHYNSY